MEELIPAARAGLPVLGTCNGFQILCEAHLLPGALTRNEGLHYVCRDQRIRVENTATAWTGDYTGGQEIVLPVKHGEGRYVADAATIDALRERRPDRVQVRGRQPQRLVNDIAGIANEAGNIVGLMPHPSTRSKT